MFEGGDRRRFRTQDVGQRVASGGRLVDGVAQVQHELGDDPADSNLKRNLLGEKYQ